MSNYLELAEYLAEAEKYSEIENTILHGIAACGEHSALKVILSEVKSRRAQVDLATSEARQAADLKRHRPTIRIPWLEAALCLAALVLALQLFPPLAAKVWQAIDVRHWSRLTWFAANVLLVLLLYVFRFGPDTMKAWRKRKRNRLLQSRTRQIP